MRLPLYLSSNGRTVRLASCRNCGKVKLLSRPCGFDHLAAFVAYRDRGESPPSTCRRCGISKRAAIAGVLCDPPYAGVHDFAPAAERMTQEVTVLE